MQAEQQPCKPWSGQIQMPETERHAQLQHKGMRPAMVTHTGQRMHFPDEQQRSTEYINSSQPLRIFGLGAT